MNSVSKNSMQTIILGLIATSLNLGFLNSCSDTKFAGGNAKAAKAKANESNVAADNESGLTANFNILSGTKVLKLTAKFLPKTPISNIDSDFKADLELVPGSLTSEPSGEFPAELATQIAKANFTGTLQHTSTPASSNVLMIVMETAPISFAGSSVSGQKVELKQTSADLNWTKNEGAVTYFGNISEAGTGAACQIEKSGEQPKKGVNAVILTKPAPCDFKMPSVKIGTNQNAMTEISIGTYWKSAAGVSHTFPLVNPMPMNSTGSVVSIDNGFILVTPAGKSYLLVDAGRYNSSGKKPDVIANEISATLGFGPTQLLQPVAGSKADNFATSTVFPKGSIIAIYDDTPDMAGGIDVSALIESASSSGMTMQWSASGSL